ncbi:MAG: TIGR03435 family protein [Acidobacteria bacterium]|nr:TIGR03435 family protein [Acidobacteriota bacterium]
MPSKRGSFFLLTRELCAPMKQREFHLTKTILARLVIFAAVFGSLLDLSGWPGANAQSSGNELTKNIADTWQGAIHDWNDLRIVVVISKMGNGGYSAIYYVIATGTRGSVDLTTVSGGTVKLENHGIGSYEGRLSQNGKSIVGTWNLGIGPGPVPLTLERATPDTAWRIPQSPPQQAPMAPDANPVFEVATIRPSRPDEGRMTLSMRARRFSTINVSLIDLIRYAYDLHVSQILKAPAWAESDKYDITAEPDGEGEPSEKQWKVMCQKLLADRFGLNFHRDEKRVSAYVLSVAKSGPKLSRSMQDPTAAPSILMQGLGAVSFKNADISDLAGYLQQIVLDRPAVDQTGLSGKWDFALKWSPDSSQFASLGVSIPEADSPDSPPKLYTAIQEQLGLKLSADSALTEVLVIDQVQKPSPN